MYPRQILYAFVGILPFMYAITSIFSNEKKFIKNSSIKSKAIFGTSELFAFFGVVFGFIIEDNNLEMDKKFVDLTYQDFIFPISLTSFLCIPATFVIYEIYKKHDT